MTSGPVGLLVYRDILGRKCVWNVSPQWRAGASGNFSLAGNTTTVLAAGCYKLIAILQMVSGELWCMCPPRRGTVFRLW